jgi:hypothetical protein
MTLYNVPRPEYVSAIERDGFHDYAKEWHEGKLLLGVRLSVVPLWELWLPNPVAFVFDLKPESLAAYECTTEHHGYRQWVVPARIVNQANRGLIRRHATHIAGHTENTG